MSKVQSEAFDSSSCFEKNISWLKENFSAAICNQLIVDTSSDSGIKLTKYSDIELEQNTYVVPRFLTPEMFLF